MEWNQNPQCLKRPGATKLEFKGEHQPYPFPKDERNTQPQEVHAFKCCQLWYGRGYTRLFVTGGFSKEQYSVSNAKGQRLGRLVSETLSSQPSLPTALPVCHQAGQPSSAMLLLPPLPTLPWRWKCERREAGTRIR